MNVVIDAPDRLKNMDADTALEEDLSINDMESVMEVVLEQGLDIENAIPETDDQESEDLCKKVEILEFLEIISPKFQYPLLRLLTVHNTSFEDYFSVIFQNIDSPPPKV